MLRGDVGCCLVCGFVLVTDFSVFVGVCVAGFWFWVLDWCVCYLSGLLGCVVLVWLLFCLC